MKFKWNRRLSYDSQCAIAILRALGDECSDVEHFLKEARSNGKAPTLDGINEYFGSGMPRQVDCAKPFDEDGVITIQDLEDHQHDGKSQVAKLFYKYGCEGKYAVFMRARGRNGKYMNLVVSQLTSPFLSTHDPMYSVRLANGEYARVDDRKDFVQLFVRTGEWASHCETEPYLGHRIPGDPDDPRFYTKEDRPKYCANLLKRLTGWVLTRNRLTRDLSPDQTVRLYARVWVTWKASGDAWMWRWNPEGTMAILKAFRSAEGLP